MRCTPDRLYTKYVTFTFTSVALPRLLRSKGKPLIDEYGNPKWLRVAVLPLVVALLVWDLAKELLD